MEYVDSTRPSSDQQRQGPRGASAQGTWCESHIMAPAVCILNPSNGTHNCRPGEGLRWVRSPTAAHRSMHALARSSKLRSEPHWEGASFASALIPCGIAAFFSCFPFIPAQTLELSDTTAHLCPWCGSMMQLHPVLNDAKFF